MNELQKIEFDMLRMFVSICEKLNLKYYLVCGSALGAVKYGGFIPWDDDIDVALPRDDYEFFVKNASKYLPEHIFLQNYQTDYNYPSLGTKLRNSKTTFIEVGHSNIKMHHGVFIDIFPLDGFPTSNSEIRKLKKAKKKYIRRIAVRLTYDRFSKKNIFGLRTNLMYICNCIFGLYSNTHKYVTCCEKSISKYSLKESNIWCNHANSPSEKEYANREQYGEGIMMKFEGLNVRIPERYDEYLTQKYGDWRKDIPKSDQKGHHYYTVCDLSKPYTEYIKN